MMNELERVTYEPSSHNPMKKKEKKAKGNNIKKRFMQSPVFRIPILLPIKRSRVFIRAEGLIPDALRRDC